MSDLAPFCVNNDAGRDLREQFSEEELSAGSAQVIQVTLDACEEELMRLQIEALKISDIIWDEIHERRANGERAKLGIRVRRIKSTLQIVWYKNATSKAGIEGKITARQLNKGGRKVHRYDNTVFASCAAWERDNAVMAEDRFALLRERASIVSDIRTKTMRYAKLLNIKV